MTELLPAYGEAAVSDAKAAESSPTFFPSQLGSLSGVGGVVSHTDSSSDTKSMVFGVSGLISTLPTTGGIRLGWLALERPRVDLAIQPLVGLEHPDRLPSYRKDSLVLARHGQKGQKDGQLQPRVVAGVTAHVSVLQPVGVPPEPVPDPQRRKGRGEVARVGAGVGRQPGHAVPLPQVPELHAAVVPDAQPVGAQDPPPLQQVVGGPGAPVHDDEVPALLVVCEFGTIGSPVSKPALFPSSLQALGGRPGLSPLVYSPDVAQKLPEPFLHLVLVLEDQALGVEAHVKHGILEQHISVQRTGLPNLAVLLVDDVIALGLVHQIR
ncbi:hypothetical protein PG987_016497 [Apiospora arundinis]